jgi:hypothetical protein
MVLSCPLSGVFPVCGRSQPERLLTEMPTISDDLEYTVSGLIFSTLCTLDNERENQMSSLYRHGNIMGCLPRDIIEAQSSDCRHGLMVYGC